MNCTACKTPLTYRGQRRFHATAKSEFLSDPEEIQLAIEFYDIYVCPQCRRLEFFLPEEEEEEKVEQETENRGEAGKIAIWDESPTLVPSDEIIIGTGRSASVPDLLKITPLQSDINHVIQELGQPTKQFPHREQTIFHYMVSHYEPWHVIAFDNTNMVHLVAIYNQHHQFTAGNLREAYGEPELATVINGREHWIFEWQGVALVAEGRDEDDILYVQFFDPKTNLDKYLEADGFSLETFGQPEA